MGSICRLANRKLLISTFSNKPDFFTLCRHVTLKATPYKTPPEQDHDDRNMKLGRPQSPHLSIYAWQLTASLSISHRMTGVLLGGYAFMLGASAVVLPEQISHYIDAIQALHLNSASLFAIKFSLAFPFCYHYFNGIRHLLWDLGKFLTISDVYKTGYAMLGVATVSAIVLSAM